MTTAPAGLRDVSVSSAEVTIQIVNVADRPMTISVFNQLPTLSITKTGSLAVVGWINRCPASPHSGGEHRHLLVALKNGPALACAHVDEWTRENVEFKLRQLEHKHEVLSDALMNGGAYVDPRDPSGTPLRFQRKPQDNYVTVDQEDYGLRWTYQLGDVEDQMQDTTNNAETERARWPLWLETLPQLYIAR